MKSRHVFAVLAATLFLARPDAASPAQFERIEHVGQACLIAVMRPFVRETKGANNPYLTGHIEPDHPDDWPPA